VQLDTPLWAQQRPDTLRYLVVDELHTFDGAQGTDLACLIRRLKGRLEAAPGQLVCVGTSATLGDGGGDSLLSFARDIFGEAMDADAVIGEDRISGGRLPGRCAGGTYLSPQPNGRGPAGPGEPPQSARLPGGAGSALVRGARARPSRCRTLPGAVNSGSG
jgi:hypothetical protein